MDRDTIALSVLPGLLATAPDYRVACAQAFAAADAFLDARAVQPVVCVDLADSDSPAVAACYEMGRSLFEAELKPRVRAHLVETVRAWVTAGDLPGHQEAVHAMLGGLYDALMEAMTQEETASAPPRTPDDTPWTAGTGTGDVDAEVNALIKLFELPSVDAPAGSDGSGKE